MAVVKETSLKQDPVFKFVSQMSDGVEILDSKIYSGITGRILQVVFDNSNSEKKVFLQRVKLLNRISEMEDLPVERISKVAFKKFHLKKYCKIKSSKKRGSYNLLGILHPLLANVYSAVVCNQSEKKFYLRFLKEEILEDDVIVGYFQKWIEGKDLWRVLEDGRIFVYKLKKIIKNIVLLQDFLLSKKLIHNDIRVENVLEREDGEILLTDFDFTFMFNALPCEQPSIKSYISPEVCIHSLMFDSSESFALGLFICDIVFNKFPVCTLEKLLEKKGKIDKESISFFKKNYESFSKKYYKSVDKIPFFNFEKETWEYVWHEDISSSLIEDIQEKEKLFSLIRALLHPNPEKRICGLKILDHPFFEGYVDGEKVEADLKAVSE